MSKKRMIIMVGIPGSGKSTLARTYQAIAKLDGEECVIHSTDSYFYDIDGVYRFNPEHLGRNHRYNQEATEASCKAGINKVIIDNTNISAKERQTYIDIANKFGYEVNIERLNTPLETCLERNAARPQDRKVPEHVIQSMYKKLMQDKESS